MTKNDWYGLGTSLAVHAVLILLFGLMTTAASEPEPFGYVEVEFGPIASGQPVQRAVENQPEAPKQPDPEPEREPEPQAAPPEEAKPVDLAKQTTQVKNQEAVETPETDVISPATQNNPTKVEEPEPKPEPEPVRPLGGGAEDGSTGETAGQEGSGQEEQRSAPFQIEGLNRSTVYAPLPAYTEKVNADIKVRITVDPTGRITQVFPVLKGNPTLEKAVRDALQRWRFNTLPANAPQESQTGTITFRFRLE